MLEVPDTGGGMMVIGAHAGDAENMAGAAMLVHARAGRPATIVHMTLGEAGHPRLDPATYAEQRKAEIQESARLLRARAIWLPYHDGRLPANADVALEICDLIRRERPAVILTHWRGSIHKDHIATHDVVRDAVFYAALPALSRELPAHRVRAVYYPENWEDMDGWRPDVFLDATRVWDDYLAALRTHELMRGGISTFRYYDYYDALGTVRGCLGGYGKAVALMMPDRSWTQRLDYLPGLSPLPGPP